MVDELIVRCFFVSSGAVVHCVRPRRDVVPTADSLSFASPKESKQRKGDPTVAVRFADCSAVLGLWGLAPNSLRSLCSLRSNTRAKSVDEARLRARPQSPALLYTTHGDPNTRLASLRIGTGAHRCARCEARWDREYLRSKRPHCSWAPSEPSSSAGLCGRARLRAPRELTSRRLFERSEQSERSEFGAAAKTEQRRAVGPRPTGDEGRLSFAYFSLAKQRKVGRLSGRHPDAASAVSKSHAKAQARLRYLSPNGRGRAQGFDRLSPNGVGLSQNGDGLNPNGQHRASTKPQGVTTWTA